MGVYTVNQTDGSLQRVAGGTLFADAPIASIIPFGGETAPVGWLICDGSTLSRTEYAELFAVIGISFGEGDGETTFGIPDLRECVPVGVGKNITKSIANHDRYDLGQFKDDALGTHNHPLVAVTTATFNNAGVPVGIGNNNTPTSATHGKQLGVNYIIKAKMVGVPADLEAQIDADYQKKDLTSAVEGETTVEDALGALSTNKASKVSNATNGDIASLDANGNLVDSGYSKSLLIDNTNDAVKAISTYASAALLNITDANDIKFADAMIYCGSSVSNLPTADYYNIKVFSINNDSTVYEQIAFRSGTPVEIYTRRHTSSVGWTDWQKLVIASDLNNYMYQNRTRTNDVLASALNTSKPTIFEGNGSSYTGDVPADGFKYADFIVIPRGGDRFVIGWINGSLAFTNYFSTTSTWRGWTQFSNDIYSTSETKTNKVWIDGKPIYRKVVYCDPLPNATGQNFNHGISNIGNIVSIGGTAKGSQTIPIPHVSTGNPITIGVGSTYISITTISNMSSYSAYVILEYTKTTD